MPVAPYETESAMEAPCDGHGRTLAMEALNLIPVFAFDFPCLRPLPPDDGNGRVSAGLPRPRTPANGDVVRAIRPMKPRK